MLPVNRIPGGGADWAQGPGRPLALHPFPHSTTGIGKREPRGGQTGARKTPANGSPAGHTGAGRHTHPTTIVFSQFLRGGGYPWIFAKSRNGSKVQGPSPPRKPTHHNLMQGRGCYQ